MASLPLKCACGAVRAEVDTERVNRVVCYCDDCQAYARALGRDDLLDERGGTDIFQVPPNALRFTAGREHLAILRLSRKGLVRAYAACCKTPVGNMLENPRGPFVGIPDRFVEGGAAALDAAVGPPRGAIQGKFAVGGCPPGVDATVSFPVLAKSVGFVISNVVRGTYRGSPFFDAEGRLALPVRVLTKEERAAVTPGRSA
ncbi:MAG: DUF6151 family protein [Myxococcota bacterium]